MQLNLSRAARTLHVSQSALSKHITALERECGVTLLARSTHQIELTRAGKILFEDASIVMRVYGEMLERVRAAGGICDIVVSGLYQNARVIELVNGALAALNEPEPIVGISYKAEDGQSGVEMLEAKQADVVFTILAGDEPLPADVQKTFLFDDPMICLVKRSHPLAGRGTITVEELAHHTILQPVGAHTTEHGRCSAKRIFDEHGIKPMQRPVFVRSISEFATVENEECVLIMESTMLNTQAFSEEYEVLQVDGGAQGANFSFYALHRENLDKPLASQLVHELAVQAHGEQLNPNLKLDGC